MRDSIYRQAAIDKVQAIERLATLPDNDAVIRVGDVESVLFDLPSAEPEWKKCKWCESLKERHLRIEYYWIDSEGCTASFQDKEGHIVATGIANFCPNCGAKMEGEQP